LRICFALGDLHGCGALRCIFPGRALRERGYEVAFITDRRDLHATTCDVLVIQRQTEAEFVVPFIREIQSRGIKVIHEVDDLFSCLPKTNPNASVYYAGSKHTKGMESVTRACDAMIVSTPRLAEEYRHLTPSMNVCLNAIPNDQAEKHSPKEITGAFKCPGEIRIGWAGSATHAGDFSLVENSLLKILEEFPEVKFVFIGADMRGHIPFRLRHRASFLGGTSNARPFTPHEAERNDLATHRYYDLIRKADFDIAIAPIESTRFNASKSYLKPMEWGFLGIPSVISNHAEFRRYARESTDQVVLLADDEKQWYRQLKALIESQQLRASLARANLEYVRKEHLMSKRVTKWERVFDFLMKKSDVAA